MLKTRKVLGCYFVNVDDDDNDDDDRPLYLPIKFLHFVRRNNLTKQLKVILLN